MELILKNIGMIKEANIKINNLAVIAGENDTGKSTVGKILMAIIKTDLIARAKYFKKEKELKKLKERNKVKENLKKYFYKNRKFGFNRFRELLFKDFLRTNSDLYELEEKEHYAQLVISEDKYLKVVFNKHLNEWEFTEDSIDIQYKNPYKDVTYIQSPLIWDLQGFFNSILQMKSQIEIEEDIKFQFEYPYILWDLYGKFINKRIKYISKFHKNILNSITEKIINGKFIKKESNIFVFRRKNIDIPVVDVAHGIKSFGILQVLLENGYISRYGILIIDEPEVHLHPKWQLKYAEIIVKLIKHNIKILLNTHSPFIIEAIKVYSEKEEVENKVRFYLSEEGYIKEQDTLENIFEKIALPMRKLKNLKLERYYNGKE